MRQGIVRLPKEAALTRPKRLARGNHKMKTTKKQTVQFANAASDVLVSFNNEIAIGADGWAQLAPIGDFPSMALMPDGKNGFKKVPAIQRIDKQAVDAMVAEFNNDCRGARKFFSGRPIYYGHPDVKGFESRFPDKAPKGIISEMEARADGLYGKPVFTTEGNALLDSKKVRMFSARMSADPTDEKVNDMPVYRTDVLISAGLVPKSHLPVQMLNDATFNLAGATAEAEKQTNNKNMKKKLLEVCKALGIQFANDADDAATEAALAEVETKVAAFANEKQTLTNKVTGLETDKTKLAGDVTKLTADLGAANTNFVNERDARINDEVATAVTSGRITAADETAWKGRLKVPANFANELTAIRALKPVVKTDSVTITRGDRKVEVANAAERRELVQELVTEAMPQFANDYDRAFAHVQKKFPQLFESMQQPEIGPKKKK